MARLSVYKFLLLNVCRRAIFEVIYREHTRCRFLKLTFKVEYWVTFRIVVLNIF